MESLLERHIYSRGLGRGINMRLSYPHKHVTVRDVRRVKYDERGWNVIMLLICMCKCIHIIVSVSNYDLDKLS